MEKLEKVIKGLECCTSADYDNWEQICAECPYNNGRPHCADLERDALEILKSVKEALKAQEPRVLTLDEAKKADVCWYEKKGLEPVLQVTIVFRTFGYGKTWRCWSSKPTEEQREAVKWDGEA